MINIFSDRKEPLIYNFAGIRISKIKVLRIVNILLKNGLTINIVSLNSLLQQYASVNKINESVIQTANLASNIHIPPSGINEHTMKQIAPTEIIIIKSNIL